MCVATTADRVPTMNAKTPQKLKTPQPCRYCGHVSDTHRHERKGYTTRPAYECRDAAECGRRIRTAHAAAGIPQDNGDLPF